MVPLLLSILFSLEPVRNVRAFDTPDDGGGSITVTWEIPESDTLITRIEIFRLEGSTEATPELVGYYLRPQTQFVDNTVKDGIPYYYFVRIRSDSIYVDSKITKTPAISKAQWFSSRRLPALIILVLYFGFLMFYIFKAKTGGSLFVRKIAGLEAIDEAVGRSTEMGRPILYILGLGYISDIPTVASLAILKRVSKKAAEYEAEVIVPCFDPIVMVAAQETVKEGYLEAGRPDLYNEGQVFYLTSDQFGYAAGVDGIMLRQRPGAVFLQGLFFAESLILAETGHSIGAIQISGTTAVTQLPFFIAATDYTLIGEEMYAASAYLSKDPLALGTIKGEDIAKMVLVVLILMGTLMETMGIHWLSNFFALF